MQYLYLIAEKSIPKRRWSETNRDTVASITFYRPARHAQEFRKWKAISRPYLPYYHEIILSGLPPRGVGGRQGTRRIPCSRHRQPRWVLSIDLSASHRGNRGLHSRIRQEISLGIFRSNLDVDRRERGVDSVARCSLPTMPTMRSQTEIARIIFSHQPHLTSAPHLLRVHNIRPPSPRATCR